MKNVNHRTGDVEEPCAPRQSTHVHTEAQRLIDLCDFWLVAKRRSHQAIQRIYISVHQQKLEIKDFIKHLNTEIENKNNHFHSCIDLKRKIQMQSSFIRKKRQKIY